MSISDSESLWRDRADFPTFEPLRRDLEVDVAIVGAGITGLTLAWHLRSSGYRVVVLERDRVASGVSGRTTGHLTTFPDAGAKALLGEYGEDGAHRLVTGMASAIEHVEVLTSELEIDCDFRRVDGHLFAASDEDRSTVTEELEALRRIGVPAQEGTAAELPFGVPGSLCIPRQARFHPGAYLAALARAVEKAGIPIHEGTRAHHLKGRERPTVETQHGHKVVAGDVVLATHTPAGVDPLQTAVAPYRSYVVAFRPEGTVPEGLYWDTASPYHYIRPQGELLVVGGSDHKTGTGDAAAAYADLERWIAERFRVREITHRWSSQVYEPVDGLPFIGRRATNRHVWVATGYSGDGLVWGTVAAQVLAARLLGESHPLASLVDTRRFQVKAGAGRFLKENAGVAEHFVADRLSAFGEGRPEDVGPGEGKVLRKGTKLLAVHRGADEALHVRNAVCPHLKCVVQWNGAEESWDCPCHGARYDVDGQLLEGPSMHDLHEVDLD